MKRVKWRDPMDEDPSGGRRDRRWDRNQRDRWLEYVDADEEDADELDDLLEQEDWVDGNDPDEPWLRRRSPA